MHPHDRIPLFLRHVEDHPITEDPGDVHEDVELAELVQRGADEVFGLVHVRNVRVVRDRLPAGSLDISDRLSGRRVVSAFARDRHAEVVHDDLCAFLREQQRHFAADAAASAGDDGCLTFEFSCQRDSPASNL